MDRVIIHSDANCFYASVEMLYHPEFAGKPLAVGGDPEARHGIVLTANYIAKKHGVKTGMALWRARQACPDVIFVPPRMDLYLKFSSMLREIYGEYTDKIEPYGCDEAWLDVSDSISLKGDGRKIADEISARVKKELGITVSEGISWNKIYEKLGSDYKKPDAITEFNRENYKSLIWKLPASDLLYVGRSTNRTLSKYGIHTIGDLACTDPDFLLKTLGKMGLVIHSFANGWDEKYSKYFGFTVDEVNTMAAYYGQEAKLEELREWYDGYRFGSTEIYNPWSVANYFYNNCQAKPYWTNTSDNEIIREIMISLTPDIAEILFALLQGQTVQASLNMDVIYPRITDGTDTIFSFLLLAGYLKPVSDAVETEFGTFMELALPNKEIRRVYNTEILSWLRGTVDGNVMAGLEKALYLNDGKKLQEFLRKYMITCISCFDGAAEGRTRSGGPWLCADRSGTETFYHGMMLGLAAGMSSRYYIRSNRESGEGRFDLVLEPKVHFLPGIIMEFKATKNDAGLSASADEALKQIEDKHYDTDMKDRGIREIVKYGIAFAGKNVEIAIG